MEGPVAKIVHILEGHHSRANSAENNDKFRVLSNKINVLENRAKARKRALLMVRKDTKLATGPSFFLYLREQENRDRCEGDSRARALNFPFDGKELCVLYADFKSKRDDLGRSWSWLGRGLKSGSLRTSIRAHSLSTKKMRFVGVYSDVFCFDLL